MAHQIEDVEVEEEEYDENADEDFNPDAADAQENASSSDEEEEAAAAAAAAKATPRRGKKGVKRKSAEVSNDLDSGDEATIQEQTSKKRRKAAEEDESGGEGGLIRTRAQRLAEKIEKKQRRRVVQGEVTIDVDQLWAELSSAPVGRNDHVIARLADEDGMDVDGNGEQNKENAPVADQMEMITIKRRIEYAGEITEVEESVARGSKAAQQYLAEHPEEDPNYKPDIENPLQRPLRRPSIFEPNPTATVKGVPPDKLRPKAPSRLDVIMAERRAEEERQKKAERMTTVQKSALDWRGFVEKQGLREELDEYGKSKHGFLAREEFLDRAQFARDVQAREARLKG